MPRVSSSARPDQFPLDARSKNPVIYRVAGLLSSIGLRVEPDVLSQDCFLRGLDISHGKLRIDESRLAYPGDILHEAGHLAVFSSQARRKLHGSVGDDPGNEMAAIAWPYAAAIFLEIALTVVLHANSCMETPPPLIHNFSIPP